MYHVRLNLDGQEIVIEDRDGNVIAVKTLPHQRWPNPGFNKLMGVPENRAAWERAYDLAAKANKPG